MTMIPQDRDPMLVKARVLLGELDPDQRAAVVAFGRREPGDNLAGTSSSGWSSSD